MRITIDLTPSVQSHAGLGRYSEELTRALLDTPAPDEQICAFYNDPQQRRPISPLDELPASTLAISNKLWRAAVMAAHVLRRSQDSSIGQPDVFYATDHLLPYLRNARTLFTVADVTFLSHPRTHSLLNRLYLQMMFPRFLRAADAVVAISKCTLHEAQSRYGLVHPRSCVIYPGVAPRFQPLSNRSKGETLRSQYRLPDRFLLYVSTIEPRKNLPMLFEAFKQANLPGVKLVIAGKKGWLYNETWARVRVLGLEQDVVFTGFVPDDDLPTLYTLAEAFVYPSLYEGFGLPVLEAMACGTPAICSDTSSLPEVAGDAALLVSPTDIRGWANALAQVTHNPTLHADLRERGLRQAARFRWSSTARQTRELYRDLYAHRA